MPEQPGHGSNLIFAKSPVKDSQATDAEHSGSEGDGSLYSFPRFQEKVESPRGWLSKNRYKHGSSYALLSDAEAAAKKDQSVLGLCLYACSSAFISFMLILAKLLGTFDLVGI